jgi:hypothetical protein
MAAVKELYIPIYRSGIIENHQSNQSCRENLGTTQVPLGFLTRVHPKKEEILNKNCSYAIQETGVNYK